MCVQTHTTLYHTHGNPMLDCSTVARVCRKTQTNESRFVYMSMPVYSQLLTHHTESVYRKGPYPDQAEQEMTAAGGS